MIIWVASFPRSGNTFLRIILKQLYGVHTSTVYDVDGVAARLGPDLIGFEERPSSIEEMRASEKLHFVKTHRQRAGEEDRAICLIRDGRDSITSWAHLTGAPDIEAEIRTMINRRDQVGTGSWGQNVLSWLRPPAPHRVMLRYEELVREPRQTVEKVLATLAPTLRPLPDARIPTFAELHQVDAGFFRRGHTGTHADELPEELHQLFWSRPDNVTAMELLGYSRDA
ncbi:sulfotransferase domain-containing protein [Nonomuraea sp. NPDC005650]|uniref:sulfotransferase domain-containing protein n=1 Tax=Nonomuraea sp. NPDC005650 TaxID=3157045 RepID=UPI0033ABF74A